MSFALKSQDDIKNGLEETFGSVNVAAVNRLGTSGTMVQLADVARRFCTANKINETKQTEVIRIMIKPEENARFNQEIQRLAILMAGH